jgi:hypothetical protein
MLIIRMLELPLWSRPSGISEAALKELSNEINAQSDGWYRGLTELVQQSAYRESSHSAQERC